MTMRKPVIIWLSFIPIAIANGLLREKCLVPLFGPPMAQSLSGISLGLLYFLLVYHTLPWFGALPPRQYWRIGLVWLIMTILFEFLFGRFVARKSWGELLQAYDLTTGNLWLLVLVVITVSPPLAAKLRNFGAVRQRGFSQGHW